MGLYLCVFEDDEELEGVEVGSYGDFGAFRETVAERLEDGIPGSKFRTLMDHSDSDGEWTAEECVRLKQELKAIRGAFKRLPGIPFRSDWQQSLARSLGLREASLNASFIDVDGEPLLDRLLQLCDLAIERGQSILFQ